MTEEQILNRALDAYSAIFGKDDHARDRVVPILKQALREVAASVELEALKQKSQCQ